MKNHIVVKCRKCGDCLVIYADKLIEKLQDLSEKPCPTCGEEPYDNWLLGDVIIQEGVDNE